MNVRVQKLVEKESGRRCRRLSSASTSTCGTNWATKSRPAPPLFTTAHSSGNKCSLSSQLPCENAHLLPPDYHLSVKYLPSGRTSSAMRPLTCAVSRRCLVFAMAIYFQKTVANPGTLAGKMQSNTQHLSLHLHCAHPPGELPGCVSEFFQKRPPFLDAETTDWLWKHNSAFLVTDACHHSYFTVSFALTLSAECRGSDRGDGGIGFVR